MLELLTELCRERGVAIVLVSHDPQAAGYADRVLALRDGNSPTTTPTRGSPRPARAGWGAGAARHRRRVPRTREVQRRVDEARQRAPPLPRALARAGCCRSASRCVGIAAGVGLLFASQIASSSLSSSVGQLNSGIVGAAKLQLTARDAHGFPEKLVGEGAARCRGACGGAAARSQRERDRARRAANRWSSSAPTAALAKLNGALVRKVGLTPFAGVGAIVLPVPVAKTIGVQQVRRPRALPGGAGTQRSGALRAAHRKADRRADRQPDRGGPLEYAQEASGLPGSREPLAGRARAGTDGRRASRAWSGSPAGALAWSRSSYDEALFAKAAAATNQSTQLFAVISALVGFLFAFNAMLLTVPQRRRLIADLRRDGYTPRAVIGVLMFDAVVLGAIACAIGLVLGDELRSTCSTRTPATCPRRSRSARSGS